jgi:hypothetical protein
VRGRPSSLLGISKVGRCRGGPGRFACPGTPGGRPRGGVDNIQLTNYQPASRLWEFQSIEAGIFVALTLIALGAAVWLMHRRVA